MISSTTECFESEKALKTASATSSGFINRSGGKSAPSQLAVKVAPGIIAVTFTSYSFISSRNTFVIPNNPNLEIQYEPPFT